MKKIIKIISFVFALTILTNIFLLLNVSAATALVKLTGPSSVIPGDDFTLTLSFDGLSKIAPDGIKTFGPIGLTYDSSILVFKSVELTFPDKNGFINSGFLINLVPSSTPAIIGPNTTNIATIKFAVGKSVKTGPTNISITGTNNFGIILPNDENISTGNSIISGPVFTLNIPSNNAELTNLVILDKEFTPAFNSKVLTGYSLIVPNEVSEINVSAIKSDANAKIKGDGFRALNVGNNTITVEVTAQDLKTKKNYVISVERQRLLAVSSTVSSQSQLSSTVSGTSSTDESPDTLKAKIGELKNTNKSILEQFSVVIIILLTLIAALITALIVLIIRLREYE